MSVFGRHLDAKVTALSWRRTVVVEQGFWEFRRTSWKPHGDGVRNINTVHTREPDIVGGHSGPREGVSLARDRTHEVMAEHTYFEHEELVWRTHRSYTAKGDGPGDVHWPEYTLGADQRIGERRESYRATFAAGSDEYKAELDEATWRTLKRVGRRCRLKVSALSGEVKQVDPA
jgi:hypothetical protein